MPPKSNKTKKAKGSIMPASAGARGRPVFRSGQMTNVSAPAAVASVPLNSDFQFSGKPNGVLNIKCCFPTLNVGKNTAFSADGSVLVARDSTVYSFFYLNFGSSFYLANFQQFIGNSFARFRVNKVTAHYRPVAAVTTGSWGLTFGAADDAQHPLVISPSQASLLDLGGFSFASWQSWDYQMPLRNGPNDWYYMYQQSSSVGANLRVAYPGAFACVSNGAYTPSTGAYGQIWFTMDVDLCDPYPVATTISSIRSHQLALAVAGTSDEELEAKRRDPETKTSAPDRTVFEVVDAPTGAVSSYITQYGPIASASDESYDRPDLRRAESHLSLPTHQRQEEYRATPTSRARGT